ncbi:MAG: hypothetical protein EOO05_16770 [Chitinophagaceae bacterium]|nr:MAG: hypothetical protein EOO05_16770 [Chitinophagaceae bacterium]
MLQRVSYWYLVLIPFMVAIGGFALPEMSPAIYIPIWMVMAILMVTAFTIIRNPARLRSSDNLIFPTPAPLLLIAPWFFISVFFGFGPPPSTVEGWVANLTEQQVRYAILLIPGLLVPAGFVILCRYLKLAGETTFSAIGQTAILIAAPLFLLNMAYWGTFLGEAFKGFVASGSTVRPDWYAPVRALLESLSTIEVALFYLATLAFAFSLKKSSVFKPFACHMYIVFSMAGFILDICGSFLPEPVSFAGYLVAIPAIPLIMPYLMGVNLLKLGNKGTAEQKSSLQVLKRERTTEE